MTYFKGTDRLWLEIQGSKRKEKTLSLQKNYKR